MENHNLWWIFPLNMAIFTVMLNYQRVSEFGAKDPRGFGHSAARRHEKLVFHSLALRKRHGPVEIFRRCEETTPESGMLGEI